jgi:hypothetical protein
MLREIFANLYGLKHMHFLLIAPRLSQQPNTNCHEQIDFEPVSLFSPRLYTTEHTNNNYGKDVWPTHAKGCQLSVAR